jgi:hypothetical protein
VTNLLYIFASFYGGVAPIEKILYHIYLLEHCEAKLCYEILKQAEESANRAGELS